MIEPIRLYEGAAPGVPEDYPPEVADEVMGSRVTRNVSVPTLTPFLPSPDRATGAVVIVAPGGGYRTLAIHHEGYDVARALAERGIAAFVLKYRVNATPNGIPMPTPAEIEAMIANPQSAYVTFQCPAAVADGAAAVRLIRARAKEWSLDPQRVGFLGFSAGAITALKLATGAAAGRPDFAASIYGPVEAIDVPADAPPLFGVLSLDDQLFANKGFGLLDSWRRAGRPLEFMLYERGGHGYGLGKAEQTESGWLEAFVRWLKMRGVVADRASR
jgi:dienelactone hydrolase